MRVKNLQNRIDITKNTRGVEIDLVLFNIVSSWNIYLQKYK